MPLYSRNEKIDVLGPKGTRQAALVVRPPTPGARGEAAMLKVRVTRKGHYGTGELLVHRDLVTARRVNKTVRQPR